LQLTIIGFAIVCYFVALKNSNPLNIAIVRNLLSKCNTSSILGDVGVLSSDWNNFESNALGNAIRLSSFGFAYLGVLIDALLLKGTPDRWGDANPLKALGRAVLFVLYGVVLILPLYFIPKNANIGVFIFFARIVPGFLFLTFLMSVGKYPFLLINVMLKVDGTSIYNKNGAKS
jgi:hypothetical protein